MEYCLCIKPNDKNLLHIVKQSDLRSVHYAAYSVIATASDEPEAFSIVAELVQDFCDAHGTDFSFFHNWAKEVRT
ncbi:MAG: hypothetical protein FWE34_05720 [Defluviitaleaceae bacterium]|nr:hypothetical protein [Defluviitaleaceae bacterium]